MESFEFNGVTNSSLDIVVKDLPLMPRAEKNIESISVQGRNGNLYIDNNTYKTKPYTISCIGLNKEKLDDINKTYIGYGILKLSKYPDRYFRAMIKNQIAFEKYLSLLQEFPLQFEIDPIAFCNEETEVQLAANGTIEVGGNIEVPPIITIVGIGTITINGYSLEVKESNITIDCDLMNCVSDNLNKNDMVILDEFPKLKVGSNEVTLGAGIEKIIVKYRKGWL